MPVQWQCDVVGQSFVAGRQHPPPPDTLVRLQHAGRSQVPGLDAAVGPDTLWAGGAQECEYGDVQLPSRLCFTVDGSVDWCTIVTITAAVLAQSDD